MAKALRTHKTKDLVAVDWGFILCRCWPQEGSMALIT